MAKKGVSKQKPVKTGGGTRGQKGVSEPLQQPVMEPISLPTEALAEVCSFLPRAKRAHLALVSGQTADAIVPGVNAERKRLLSTAPAAIALYEERLTELHQQSAALLARSGSRIGSGPSARGSGPRRGSSREAVTWTGW